MIENWKNGDYDLAVAGGLQMLSSLSAIFMKCFTGDTLVATEDGDKRIDEIAVGDSVWAEDTVTGERVLKKVLKVYVKETDHLVHIGTSTGDDIETTENHPFYVDGRGWVVASEVREGDQLHTEDGSIITVTYNQDEWLREPIKVYNLEVEGLHTYYVTADRVLVHNQYGEVSPALKDSPYNPDTVDRRIKPDYVSNPAHGAGPNICNPNKTPEPNDAKDIYNNAVRGGMGEWYGINDNGDIYQFFYDNFEGVHFAGIISKEELAKKCYDVVKQLGISMKGK